MTHLFRGWDAWAERIRDAHRLGLLCDFDGTLSPIVRHPGRARLSVSRRRLLRALVQHPRVTIGVVSGRALGDLRRRVAVGGIYYAGNHGLEIVGPGLHFRHPGAVARRPVLARIAVELRRRLAEVPGVLVEDKGLTLSLHLRRVASQSRPRARRVFAATLGPHRRQGAVAVTRGKLVLEVRPAVDWDKGGAVRMIRKAIAPKRGSGTLLLCYLGDDATDEAAFRALGAGDLALFVGRRKRGSAAAWYLRDPGEVADFLRRVERVTGS
jgi:trehalose 6-phosphate phosphatase